MHINKLRKSRFLSQRDVEPPLLLTIKECKEDVNIAREGDRPQYETLLFFHEIEKPLVLKPTNAGLIAAITGSEETDDWPGNKIVLYVEPTVDYGGELTGGVRARASRRDTQPVEKPQSSTEEPQAPTGDDIPF